MWSADIDENKIKRAKQGLKNTKVIYLNCERDFPLKENYFDKVILLEVLEHLREDQDVLKRINNILKKNGLLIISVPEKNFHQTISPLNWFFHYRHYTKKDLVKKLKNAGFEIQNLDMVGNWVFSINLYLSLIIRYIFCREIIKIIMEIVGGAVEKEA